MQVECFFRIQNSDIWNINSSRGILLKAGKGFLWFCIILFFFSSTPAFQPTFPSLEENGRALRSWSEVIRFCKNGRRCNFNLLPSALPFVPLVHFYVLIPYISDTWCLQFKKRNNKKAGMLSPIYSLHTHYQYGVLLTVFEVIPVVSVEYSTKLQ